MTDQGKGYRLHGAAVTVCKGYDGAVIVLRDGRELSVRLLAEGGTAPPVEDGKSVRSRVDKAKARQQSRPDLEAAAGSLLATFVQGRCGGGCRIAAARSCAPVATLPPRKTEGEISALEKRGHF